MSLEAIYEHQSIIETRFSVDPTIVAGLADRSLLSAAEGLALTEPYGNQASGFEAGQLAAYARDLVTNETIVKIADNAGLLSGTVRGVFADSLINTLRTFGLQQVNSADTVKVSIYHSQGSFKTDVFDAAVAAAEPSTALYSNATGQLTSALPGVAGPPNLDDRPVALVDIAPNFSADSQLHFTLV